MRRRIKRGHGQQHVISLVGGVFARAREARGEGNTEQQSESTWKRRGAFAIWSRAGPAKLR